VNPFVMNPALITLIRLQSRAFVRRMVHGAASPRRAIFLALGVGVVVLWLGQLLFTTVAVRNGHGHGRQLSPQEFRVFAPLGLLGICVLTIVSSAADKAIAFTPGEVDMLFPGPFTRRQLLGYKLLKSALAAMITALFLSLALLPFASAWAACYVGVYLTLMFIQLFSTAGVLVGQAIGQRAQTLVRRVVLGAALLAGLLLARNWIAAHGGVEAVFAFRDSTLGEAILKPFDAFGRAMTAGDTPEFVGAALEAAAIDAGLIAIVMMLDANFVEAALAASRRRYAIMRRIRSGTLLGSGVKGDVKWHLPPPPWAGGAGPIAWRQATAAARSSRGLLFLLLVITIVLGPLAASVVRTAEVGQFLLGGIVWLTILLSQMLKFDFRGDLDHIDQLKSLPLRPAALAVGQLAVPTLILTGAHLLLLLSVAVAVKSQRQMLIAAACLALPFNAMLMAIENLIFLLFPTRPVAASPGDFQVLGRQVVQLVLKAIAVMSGCVLAFLIAVPFYLLAGGSMIVLMAIAGIVMTGQTCALVPAIAWAYRRFDPSLDTPS